MDDKDLRIQELKAENEKLKKQMEELKESSLDPIEMCEVKMLIGEFLEYKRLQEQGLLLKLPCNVGTQVYIINHHWIDEGFICGIAEADDIDCFCFKVYEDPDTYTLIAIDDFEKGWFLTEQEAKKALHENAVGSSHQKQFKDQELTKGGWK